MHYRPLVDVCMLHPAYSPVLKHIIAFPEIAISNIFLFQFWQANVDLPRFWGISLFCLKLYSNFILTPWLVASQLKPHYP